MRNPLLLAGLLTLFGLLLSAFSSAALVATPVLALLGYVLGRQFQQEHALQELREQLHTLTSASSATSATERPAPAAAAPQAPEDNLDWSLPEELSAHAAPQTSTQPAPRPLATAPNAQPSPAARTSTDESSDWIERGLLVAWQWLIGGNPAVKVGLVVLFFGVGFLLRYASEHVQLSITGRLSGVAAAGLALLGLGWYLRQQQRLYALLLQGGALGLLYMTVFAAFRLYPILEASSAFILLTLLAALSAALALRQDARGLASFALAGGFLAPILASTGQGSHVHLFAYYALLNLALAFIAWHKHWRELNLLGFAFTFVIGVLWGVNQYQPALLASTEPFLLLFFALYLMISVRFPLQSQHKPWLDNSLLFGTPLAFTGLQYLLLWDQPSWLAVSCLLSGLLYAGLFVLLRQRAPTLLKEALLGIALVLLSMSIPLALPGDWTAISWALEGALLLRFALLQQRHWSIVMSLLLQLGAWLSLAEMPSQIAGWGNSQFYCALILSAALICCALWLQRHAHGLQLGRLAWRQLQPILLALGLAAWLASWAWQIEALYHDLVRWQLMLCVIIASVLLARGAEWLLRWPMLGHTHSAASVLLALLVVGYSAQASLLGGYGFLLWASAAVLHSVVVFSQTPQDELSSRTLALRHTLNGVWLMLLLALCVDQRMELLNLALSERLGIQLILFSALSMALPRAMWAAGQPAYQRQLPSISALISITLWLLLCPSDPQGMHVSLTPLLNLLDISQLVALGVLWHLARSRFGQDANRLALLAGFVLLNLSAVRSAALIWDLPWQVGALWASDSLQTLLAILWTLCGAASMSLSRWRTSRVYWFAGAALLGAAVLKLFAVDLGQSGTLARIISFIAVGALLLVIGYIAPLPPADDASNTRHKEAA